MKPDKPYKLVAVAAGTDNRTDQLHPSRFELAPIAAPPSQWYAQKVQITRKDRPRNPNVSHFGANQKVSSRISWDGKMEKWVN